MPATRTVDGCGWARRTNPNAKFAAQIAMPRVMAVMVSRLARNAKAMVLAKRQMRNVTAYIPKSEALWIR
ncbi:hypothetical protein J8J20_25050, partial [Mycobacterium tuberculosis]|nr:hypothetical protein [Mycobacterium tuberculosis]